MLTQDVARPSAIARLGGVATIAAAIFGVAVHVWLVSGAFVPVRVGTAVEYAWVSATARSFVAIVCFVTALLAASHALVRRFAAAHDAQPALLSRSDVSYLRPLWCFAATLLSLFNLLRPRVPSLAVLSYVIVDMRWWWGALVALWLARNLGVRLNRGWRTWFARVDLSRGRRRWLPEVSIAAITIAWAYFGTPYLRADGATIGDEPKYVRYCETLYQGLGFEISQIKPLSELPPDFHPRLWRNVTALVRMLPGELQSLAADAVMYVRDPSHQFNVARHRQGGFIDGKHGGMYQVHNPGMSLLMFPAYYIDRTVQPIEPGSPLQWPRHMYAVKTLWLAVYAGWTILMFRFLRRCGATAAIAWVVSLVSLLAMPASAFPYQYYPELAAGLSISAVGAHILFGDPRKTARSFFFGLVTGYLLWLHVRFSIEVLALAAGAIVLWRGQWPRTIAFLAGAAIPVALFSLYVYRITGSALPSAVWSAEGSGENFNLVGMIKNTSGYLVDREWGLFAHSPVFLLALPGYWWMARQKPRIAFLCALIVVALLAPSAGKTLVQTTPMRLIVAAIPFGAVPLIVMLERRSRAVLTAFWLLTIVSLDTALSYNLHHVRSSDTLADWSFSGWKFNLLFPYDSRQPWHISTGNGVLLVIWLLVVVALLVAPAVIDWRRSGVSRPGQRRQWAVQRPAAQAFAAVVLFVLLGTAGSAMTREWTGLRYLMPPEDAAQRAAFMLDEVGTCTFCIWSPVGWISTRRMSAALTTINPQRATRRRGERPDYAEWIAMPGQIRSWYVEATGHEPSPGDIGHHLYQWREERVAPAEIRRRIFAAAGKSQ
ncbi:MAG: hypothetical protein JF610_02470 [Acidobacteria bacterium]|nr:hypothetical protein [Acidobacteriota bacterium]